MYNIKDYLNNDDVITDINNSEDVTTTLNENDIKFKLNGVVEFEMSSDLKYLKMEEQCDYYYYALLTKNAVRQLGERLIEFSKIMKEKGD